MQLFSNKITGLMTTMTKVSVATATMALLSLNAHADVLPEAELSIKIAIAKKPITRPMSIAYVPFHSRYYIADGGLTAPPGDPMGKSSPCPIHEYSDTGEYIKSKRLGLDSRAIYFNEAKKTLEVATYNISSEAGFSPSTGIFIADLNEEGDLKGSTTDVIGHNPAFGGASSMPSYNHETNQFYVKQGRSNTVLIVDPSKREHIGKIDLDLNAAKAKIDDVADYFIAYTGIKGEELAILDIDHKAILVFDIKGKFVAKSELPKTMKLRSQNHISGLAYTNGLFFVYHEPEGEFGVYHGFKISSLAH